MAKLGGRRVIQPSKLDAYLLNPDHPKGAAKARFFRSFGFERSASKVLADALHHHAETRDVVAEEVTTFGVKSVVRCNLKTPDGRGPCIVAVWIREWSKNEQSFVTAYPA